jgi:hypothetical protein
MIIQTAPSGQPHFVIEQPDHTKTCGQFAQSFGNDQFAKPVPHDLLIYIVSHHDEGWQEIDALCEQSPVTGMPHHLTQTPLPYLVRTSIGSPDFNEKQHAFCGLLSSMHTYGLFNGRYGLSDFVFIDKISVEHKGAVQAMLNAELARQARLKAQLAANPASAGWVEDAALFDNYKLLQFFDTLALYFHMNHESLRKETSFLNVPDGKGGNHTLTITPTSSGEYTLQPFPFGGDVLEVSVLGRNITPQPIGADLKPIFGAVPKTTQTYRLVK